MQESWVAQIQNIEIWCYYLATVIVAIWEYLSPRRVLSMSLRLRWLNNIGLTLFNTVLQRMIAPILAVALAWELQSLGWGFFNLVEFPHWVAVIVSFLFLDFCFYLKHRLAHIVPWFWRFHRVHHSDGDIDFTTGARFHPFDVAYQIALQFLAILIIGAPPLAVAAHAVAFIVITRFQHGNIFLPVSFDRALRLFLVTADMHRIHHSARKNETDSNYGGVLPWFDLLFGTYIDEPQGGHDGMVVGLKEFRESKHMTLGWMLITPFLPATSNGDIAAEGESTGCANRASSSDTST